MKRNKFLAVDSLPKERKRNSSLPKKINDLNELQENILWPSTLTQLLMAIVVPTLFGCKYYIYIPSFKEGGFCPVSLNYVLGGGVCYGNGGDSVVSWLVVRMFQTFGVKILTSKEEILSLPANSIVSVPVGISVDPSLKTNEAISTLLLENTFGSSQEDATSSTAISNFIDKKLNLHQL